MLENNGEPNAQEDSLCETEEAPIEETSLTVPESEIQETDAEEDQEPPAEIKIFGLPRMVFWGLGGGVGAGMILTGLISEIGIYQFESPWPMTILCCVAGYFFTNRAYKRKKEKEKNSEL